VERERTEDCPLYIVDQQGYGGDATRLAPEPPPAPRPRLAFAWAGKGSDGQRWALLVTIPLPPSDVSFIHVEENLNGGVDVSRESVRARRAVWVQAKPLQYQVIGYDKSRRPVWRPRPTDSLRILQPNLFHAGANGGAQLAPGEPLIRGNTYLSLSERVASDPPPGEWSRPVDRLAACDPKGVWDGYLVYIPKKRDDAIERWVESVCDRAVADPPPRLEVVLPAMRALGPDGVYDLEAGQEVVLAVRGGDWLQPVLEIVDEESGQVTEWPIQARDGAFLALGRV
jgi:hypothetical protein